MRLKKHLNEITKVPEKKVKEILDRGFADFEKSAKKTPFWPILLAKLKDSFSKYNIEFHNIDWRFSKTYGISGGAEIEMGLPKISIGLTKKQIKNLNNKTEIEKIKKEIFTTLTHELIHRKQNQRKSIEYIAYIDSHYKQFKDALEGRSIIKYFSGKDEIEAYAREVLRDMEIDKNPEEILRTYFIIGGSVLKRFLKKLYQYTDIYGDNKTKQKLKELLKKMGVYTKEFLKDLRKDLEDASV